MGKPYKSIFGNPAPKAFIVTPSAHTFSTSNAARTSSITGVAGMYLIAMAIATGGNAQTGTMTDNLGGTWGAYLSVDNSSPNRALCMWYRLEPLTSNAVVTVTHTPTTNDGGGLVVYGITGLSSFWNYHTASLSNPANGVPVMTNDAAPVHNRGAMIGGILASSNAPNMPTNWVSTIQTSYANPTLYASIGYCQAPNATQQTVWGGVTTSNWCGCQAEFFLP
jgi:hypothetical protein